MYHVGTAGDGRPFLAMKLIKGDTLDVLLKRGDPLDKLGVFQAMAQAVGYAYAHGVIHRDLKPANVMVGAFGEVQVMDWGLAKVLATDRVEELATDPEATTDTGSVVQPPTDADTPLTRYGSALGTPAYMPPEQAAGEWEKVGPASDVFGLGAVLCVLLTGKPPFIGESAESVRIAACRGETADAFRRLDASGAEPEVVELCKRCLSFHLTARPTDAGTVATAVADLRRAADERARQAEVVAAEGRVRAAEQGKQRRIVRAGGWLVLGLTLVGGTIAAVQWRRAVIQERATAVALADTEAGYTRTIAVLRQMTDAALSARQFADNLSDDDRQLLATLKTVWESVASSRGESQGARELRDEGAARFESIRIWADKQTDHKLRTKQAVEIYDRLVEAYPHRVDFRAQLLSIGINSGGGYLGDIYPNLDSNNLQFGEKFLEKIIRRVDWTADQTELTPDELIQLRGCLWWRAKMLTALHRHSDAEGIWNRAIKLSKPDMQLRLRASRVWTLGAVKQESLAIAEVLELFGHPELDGHDIYTFACILAVVSGRSPEHREDYAVRAVALLRRAAARGHYNYVHWLKDSDLDPLRGRADFRAVMASIRELAPPPRPVR